ncbi:MOB kinase activator-like 2 isoform X2 [Episyrphus balteatus]|uniref:MOB kinase activator-like 2 isoform X2 n=1 Tax=Episyrphus balteatus TaxID=286459 RepID=UPI002485F429|nr:MOB kinase activator-like 2 isoform X2 [Episyrphus balteatus]
MMWALSNLTGSNRVSRAILVRYSAVPSDTDSNPQTPVASNASTSSTSTSSTSSRSRNIPGRAVPRHPPQITLPLDVEETVTCFCRKARRKERDGDQNASDTKLYLEESVLERKLPEADLKALVDLPAGLDYNEWLASHTLALFEHVNLVYGTISEFCTPSGCPDMTGPGNRTYLWFDEKGKKTRVAAPQYIDYVMTFTQKTVSDELIFPTKYANEFPNSFESIARKILRLQFHVIAHLYAAHFREIALLGLHTHLNLTFAHLTALHRRFNLIDEKETDVLRDLEVALRLTDDGSNSSETASSQTGGGSSSATGAGSGGSSSATATVHHTGAAVTTMTGTVTGASEDVNLLQSGRLIDGDAMAQPICTQPEAKKGLNSEQSDIRGGAGGGGGLMGGILGDFNTSEFGDMRTGGGTSGYCIGGSTTAKSSHIGYNNNHHNGSTHNMLQCNSSSNNSSNNSPTPQQHHTSHTTTA